MDQTALTENSRAEPNARPQHASSRRLRRASLNYVSGLGLTAIGLLSALMAAPVVTRHLDQEQLGAVRMVLEYGGYLLLLDLGVGASLGPLFARALARRDEAALRATLATGLRAYLLVTGLALSFGLLMGLALPSLVPVPPGRRADVAAAWFVALAGLSLMALAPFRAVTEAAQRGFVINLLLSGQAVWTALLMVLAARMGWGVTGQIAAGVLGTAPFTILLAWRIASRYPGLLRAVVWGRSDPDVVRGLRNLSLPSLIISIASRVAVLSDGLILGLALAPSVVPVLYYTQRLAALAQGQLQAVGGACWAGLAELYNQGDHDSFNARLIELTGLVAILSMAVMGPIVAFNRRFFDLWGVSVTYGGDAIVVLAALNGLLIALFSLWSWCFVGTGKVRRLLGVAVASAALNLVVSVVTTLWLRRAYGPLLGTSVSLIVIQPWFYPLALNRSFGTPIGPLVRAVVVPVAIGVVFVYGLWAVALAHLPPFGWVGLGAEMALAAIGFLGLSAVVVLTPEQRRHWRARLEGVLPRSRRRPEAPGSS